MAYDSTHQTPGNRSAIQEIDVLWSGPCRTTQDSPMIRHAVRLAARGHRSAARLPRSSPRGRRKGPLPQRRRQVRYRIEPFSSARRVTRGEQRRGSPISFSAEGSGTRISLWNVLLPMSRVAQVRIRQHGRCHYESSTTTFTDPTVERATHCRQGHQSGSRHSPTKISC